MIRRKFIKTFYGISFNPVSKNCFNKKFTAMKNLILTASIILTTVLSLFANEKDVESKIKEVTIFPSSAQITRTGTFSTTAGVTEIILSDVSPYLNQSSIQAKGKGNFTILDVQFRVKQPEIVLSNNNELPPKIVREIAILEDSIAYLNFDLSDLRDNISALELEKNILLNNSLVTGHGGDTITELKATMEYFRIRINDINDQIQKLKRDEFKMSREYTRMNTRLNELKAYNQQENPTPPNNKPIYQVVVTVSADYAVNGTIEINYMVSNAGWIPTYDLKTSGVENPVQLIYKANVWQNTGEEWKDAKLRLSTITPTANNVKPILPVTYLSYYNYNTIETISTGGSKKDRKASYGAPASAEREEAMADLDANYAYNYTSMNQTMTNVEFDIKLNYTIPTDGQYHIIPIQNETIPTNYVYYIVPKVETQAFLIAKLTDWQELDLLPGSANIYFDGTFVGETQINPSTLSDTLELALGRDRSLQIERKQLKNETDSKLVGSVVTKTLTYQITLKNTKPANVDIVLQDNIPVSTTEDIKVKVIDNGKANYTESSGMLFWRGKLKSGETQKYTFSYEVEYDSSKPIAGNF